MTRISCIGLTLVVAAAWSLLPARQASALKPLGYQKAEDASEDDDTKQEDEGTSDADKEADDEDGADKTNADKECDVVICGRQLCGFCGIRHCGNRGCQSCGSRNCGNGLYGQQHHGQQHHGHQHYGHQHHSQLPYYGHAAAPAPVRQPAQPDLFYNYYMPSAVGGPTAAMYPAPRPVPQNVGHVYYTYQPFMPHEYLYTHSRMYYTNHGGTHFTYGPAGGNGAGYMHGNDPSHLGNAHNMVNRTSITWQRGSRRPSVMPGFHPLSATNRIGNSGCACGQAGCNGTNCGRAGCSGRAGCGCANCAAGRGRAGCGCANCVAAIGRAGCGCASCVAAIGRAGCGCASCVAAIGRAGCGCASCVATAGDGKASGGIFPRGLFRRRGACSDCQAVDAEKKPEDSENTGDESDETSE